MQDLDCRGVFKRPIHNDPLVSPHNFQVVHQSVGAEYIDRKSKLKKSSKKEVKVYEVRNHEFIRFSAQNISIYCFTKLKKKSWETNLTKILFTMSLVAKKYLSCMVK